MFSNSNRQWRVYHFFYFWFTRGPFLGCVILQFQKLPHPVPLLGTKERGKNGKCFLLLRRVCAECPSPLYQGEGARRAGEVAFIGFLCAFDNSTVCWNAWRAPTRATEALLQIVYSGIDYSRTPSMGKNESFAKDRFSWALENLEITWPRLFSFWLYAGVFCRRMLLWFCLFLFFYRLCPFEDSLI